MSSEGEEEYSGSGVRPPQQSGHKRQREVHDRSRTHEKHTKRSRHIDAEESSKSQSWYHSRRPHDDDENKQKRIESGWAAWRRQLGRDDGRSSRDRPPEESEDLRYRLAQKHKEQQGTTSSKRSDSKSSDHQRSRSPHARERHEKSKQGPSLASSVVSRPEKSRPQHAYSRVAIEMISSPSDEENNHSEVHRSDRDAIPDNSANTGGGRSNKSDTEEGERKSTSSGENEPEVLDADDHSSGSSSSEDDEEEEDVNKNAEIDDRTSKKETSNKKYSKFVSSSESESDAESKHHSDISDEEDEKMAEESDDSDGSADENSHRSADGADHENQDEASAANNKKTQENEKNALIDSLPVYFPAISGCRSVVEFDCMNRIEEGTYGVVYRAKDKRTDEIVALKRLKMEKEREGFPITSLREINTLLKAQHPNIVTVREIVVGSNMDKIYIVMDYVEHDMKSLMEHIMKTPFTIGQVKTLLLQLLRGVRHLHDNWILHRDLKASNLLLSHSGILKIGDFGLAREYGSPLKPYTPIVVTLWYRAPELLLGTKQYSTAIDMWSVGCIFGELLTMKPLFPGKGEQDQLNKVFHDLGTPREEIWPDYPNMPLVKRFNLGFYEYNRLRKRLPPQFSQLGFELINKFLTYDPSKRSSANEALHHAWFDEKPTAVPPELFPTWPAKSEQSRIPQKDAERESPKPPSAGKAFYNELSEAEQQLYEGLNIKPKQLEKAQAGFSLKFDTKLMTKH